MIIHEITSVMDAILCLQVLTKRAWTENEFTSEIIRLRLPIYAVAPHGLAIVRRQRVNGKMVITPMPGITASYMTLLQDEIEQLSRGGQTITDRPAWIFGEIGHATWSEIEARRAASHRVVANWGTDPGEWMGQSDEYFFANPVGVTPDTPIVVPRHTIAEIARRSHLRQAKNDPADTHHIGVPAASASASTDAAPMRPSKKIIWDDHNLRRLLDESRMPSCTQAALAKKYGVSPQFISKQLKQARYMFEKQSKASPFAALGGLRAK